MGPALGRDACHPGILDPHLLLYKEGLLGEPGNPSRARISAELARPRAVVRASLARAMEWIAAERTQRGQPLGRGSGKWGCRAMKVLSKNMEELSGPFGHNAMNVLDLPDTGVY